MPAFTAVEPCESRSWAHLSPENISPLHTPTLGGGLRGKIQSKVAREGPEDSRAISQGTHDTRVCHHGTARPGPTGHFCTGSALDTERVPMGSEGMLCLGHRWGTGTAPAHSL